MSKKNVIIIGAAGRDFHNFNTRYRTDEHTRVVAFTAAQIPDIEGRRYPARRLTQNLVGGVAPIQAKHFAIGYVTLSTGERPFKAINTHVNPVLGWGWAIATLMANCVWSLMCIFEISRISFIL